MAKFLQEEQSRIFVYTCRVYWYSDIAITVAAGAIRCYKMNEGVKLAFFQRHVETRNIVLCPFRMSPMRNNNRLPSDFAYANVHIVAAGLFTFLRYAPFSSLTWFEISRARRNRYKRKLSRYFHAARTRRIRITVHRGWKQTKESDDARKAEWLKRVGRRPGGVGSIKNSIHTSIRCFVGGKKAEAVREAWNVL